MNEKDLSNCMGPEEYAEVLIGRYEAQISVARYYLNLISDLQARTTDSLMDGEGRRKMASYALSVMNNLDPNEYGHDGMKGILDD